MKVGGFNLGSDLDVFTDVGMLMMQTGMVKGDLNQSYIDGREQRITAIRKMPAMRVRFCPVCRVSPLACAICMRSALPFQRHVVKSSN